MLRYLLSCIRFAAFWWRTRRIVAMLRARSDVLDVRVRPSGDPAIDARIDLVLIRPAEAITLTLDLRRDPEATL